MIYCCCWLQNMILLLQIFFGSDFIWAVSSKWLCYYSWSLLLLHPLLLWPGRLQLPISSGSQKGLACLDHSQRAGWSEWIWPPLHLLLYCCLSLPHPTPYLLTLQIAKPQPWPSTLFSERPSWLSDLWVNSDGPDVSPLLQYESSQRKHLLIHLVLLQRGDACYLPPALLKSPWGLLEQTPPSPITYPISSVC